MVTAADSLSKEMAQHTLREMMRRTGLSHHTLPIIRRGDAVRLRTLAILTGSLTASSNAEAARY